MVMTISRETIYAALFAQLQTAGTGFATYSRTWLNVWDDPAARSPNLPMCIQQDQQEEMRWSNRGIGRVLLLQVRVEIYGKIPDGMTPGFKDGSPGATVVNNMIDLVDNALAPSDLHEGLQTLGGLVLDCRIEGQIMKAFGDNDPSGQCGAVIPVILLLSS